MNGQTKTLADRQSMYAGTAFVLVRDMLRYMQQYAEIVLCMLCGLN